MDSLRKNLSEQSKRTNQLSPQITMSLDTNQLMSILHLCRFLFWGGNACGTTAIINAIANNADVLDFGK